MAKHPLQTLFDNADIKVRSYSGRGMYGQTCLGVYVENIGEFMEKTSEALLAQAEDIQRNDRDAIVVGMAKARWDNLGLGIIVYFTNVPYTDDDDEDDET